MEPTAVHALQSDARFETLFAQSPFSMQLLAADGRTLRVNRAWETLWQVTDADGVKAWVLSGQYNVLEDPQLAAKGVTPLLRRAFAGETVPIPPIRYDPGELGRPGRARWVRATAHPLVDALGKVAEVMLIHEDVTEQVESERALLESEQRLRLATDAASIGIWDWDIDRDVVTWTPEVYALHGLAPGTFGGKAADFAARLHPEDLAHVWQRIQDAVRNQSGFSAEFRVTLPEGGDRWLSTSSRVYRGSDGGLRMVGATFSIDAFKKAEAALRESDRRKDEFLAMLAHELRNPLAPIRSAAEVLLVAAHDERRARKASEVIVRQVGHVTQLVDDLLDVSRVTRGLVRLREETLDLATVLQAAFEQAGPLMEARSHSLRKALPPSPLFVKGDRARLVQVAVNLLANAARYTPPGGLIEVELRREADVAAFTVRDNGQGIDAAFLPRVFDLFSQGPRELDRSQGGLGIGLALVRRLLDLHGGSVRAESAGPGRGSAFTVELPLVDHAGGTVAAPLQAAPGSPVVPRSVMLVDDNRDGAETLAELLTLAGHSVAVHHDAASALACPTTAKTDVFLLDIGLPDLDGLELARRLRERRPDAIFAIMSGYGQPSDIEMTRRAGFRHHIVKPVDREALDALLRDSA